MPSLRYAVCAASVRSAAISALSAADISAADLSAVSAAVRRTADDSGSMGGNDTAHSMSRNNQHHSPFRLGFQRQHSNVQEKLLPCDAHF